MYIGMKDHRVWVKRKVLPENRQIIQVALGGNSISLSRARLVNVWFVLVYGKHFLK